MTLRRIPSNGDRWVSCSSSPCCLSRLRSREMLPSSNIRKKDDYKLADFMERLRFIRGELHYDADYIRGRRVKTRIAVRSNDTVTLETVGRGKSAMRWLERMQGKKLLQLVDQQ